MTTAGTASRWLSRSVRNPPQRLLLPSKTSSASPASSYSTSANKHPATVLWRSTARQLRSPRGLRPGYEPIPSCVACGELAKARRRFTASTVSLHNELVPPKPGEELHVTFIDKEGEEHTFEVAKGDNLLDIAQENDIEMEGACGGSCACSTCHVIVQDEELYNKMDEPDDDENDMLDLAFGLTETSRLGCQVKMSKELDGLRVKLPAMTRNLQASDFGKKNERSD